MIAADAISSSISASALLPVSAYGLNSGSAE